MTQLILDAPMKFFFKNINGIDPDECELLPLPLNGLEINVGKLIPVTEFLKGKINLVTLDSFSTRESNEQSIAEAEIPEIRARRYRPLYVEYVRQYGVVEFETRKVGIADTARMYNGIPGFLDYEEFLQAQDKQQAYLDALQKCCAAGAFPIRQVSYGRTYVALHRDFLKEHPVSKSKIDPRSN